MYIKLSITIPTYNRNQVLKENLEYLLPQLNENCELIILDNCSDIPVSETLSPLLANYENLNIRVIRNQLNIGICANILRCFEVCNGEWVWILGDFHPVFSNSVEIITRDLDLKKDFTFINYTSSPKDVSSENKIGFKHRDNYFLTSSGLTDFITKLDNFSNLASISVGIYNLKKVKPHINIGYLYSYSMFPHSAILLKALSEQLDGKVYFSSDKIIYYVHKPSNERWSGIHNWKTLSLLDLVKDTTSQKKLSILLSSNLSFRGLATDLLFQKFLSSEKDIDALKTYKKLANLKLIYSKINIIQYLNYTFFGLALRFYHISFYFLSKFYWIRKKGKSSIFDLDIVNYSQRI